MNIRQAILKAADSIERLEPYDFWARYVNKCGTPMCLFGWIGHHLGMEVGTCNAEVASAIGARGTIELYTFMLREAPEYMHDPIAAAKGLRLYADKYYPAQHRDVIPASVRCIFTASPAELRAALSA